MSSPGHLKWKDMYALREPSSLHTKCFCLGQNKILLFPKNFHPGSRKFIFLNQISDDILFSSSVSYAFFDSCLLFVCLFVCLFVRCFFEIKNVYSNTHCNAIFKQVVPWHSSNYRVQIHSKNGYMTWYLVERGRKDVQDVFWTSYVHSIYVLCLRGNNIQTLSDDCP